MTSQTPTNNYAISVGAASTVAFITIIEARAPNGNDGPNQGYKVGQRWVDTSDGNAEYFLLGFTASLGVVQANWVLLSAGSGVVEFLQGNTGSPVAPTAGVINVVGDASGIQTAGSGSTLTATLANIPNSSLAHSDISLIAGSGISITVSPVELGGSTTISATNAGDLQTLTGNDGTPIPPTSGNINVVGDGTTISVAGDAGTSTLTISQIPASVGFTSVNIQVFTTVGTSVYTPSADLVQCIVETLGGGGAGGGNTVIGSNQTSCGACGSAGEYARGLFSSTDIGASQVVTIGAGGVGAVATAGTNGGNTSLGALMSAFGGIGGGTNFSGGTQSSVNGSLGGTGGSGGSFRTPGAPSTYTIADAFPSIGGASSVSTGGNSQYGAAGLVVPGLNGTTGLGYGSGGGGTMTGGGGNAGGNGAPGIVIITEYISS